MGNICALYTKFGEHGSWGTNFGGKLGYGSTSAVWGTHFGGKNYGELWPTSSFACLAWTKVPHTGEPHSPSPKSQTVFIETCLPIKSDCFGCDNGSPQWGTVTNFKFCLYCLNANSPKWGTVFLGCDNCSPQWGTVYNFKVCLYCLNASSPYWGT